MIKLSYKISVVLCLKIELIIILWRRNWLCTSWGTCCLVVFCSGLRLDDAKYLSLVTSIKLRFESLLSIQVWIRWCDVCGRMAFNDALPHSKNYDIHPLLGSDTTFLRRNVAKLAPSGLLKYNCLQASIYLSMHEVPWWSCFYRYCNFYLCCGCEILRSRFKLVTMISELIIENLQN